MVQMIFVFLTFLTVLVLYSPVIQNYLFYSLVEKAGFVNVGKGAGGKQSQATTNKTPFDPKIERHLFVLYVSMNHFALP